MTRRDTCAYCGGPLPPPALTGRPRSFCSAQCRAANEWVVVSRKREEMEQRERKRLEAEREKREAERLRRAERDYQRAIKAGGDIAAEARWERLSDEELDKGYGLCQWALDNGQNGACTRRTTGVYCWRHSRQLDREAAARRRRKEAEAARQSRSST